MTGLSACCCFVIIDTLISSSALARWWSLWILGWDWCSLRSVAFKIGILWCLSTSSDNRSFTLIVVFYRKFALVIYTNCIYSLFLTFFALWPKFLGAHFPVNCIDVRLRGNWLQICGRQNPRLLLSLLFNDHIDLFLCLDLVILDRLGVELGHNLC